MRYGATENVQTNKTLKHASHARSPKHNGERIFLMLPIGNETIVLGFFLRGGGGGCCGQSLLPHATPAGRNGSRSPFTVVANIES